MDSERDYAAKRSFDDTPEPPPEVAGDVDPITAPPGDSFVIHQHHARRLHFDLRLEMRNGSTPVLVSWALPKNLPIEKGVRALAVHVEDHPFEYGGFSGTIPEGNYGAGEVRIFDRGGYQVVDRKPGKLTFELQGERMRGVWHLIQTRRESAKDWLVVMRSFDPGPEEPLPSGPPMEPGRAAEPFDDPGWAFEPCLHGLRVLAYCEYRSTELADAAGSPVQVLALDRVHERLVARRAVVDGVLSGEGESAGFVAVDLLYLDGRSLIAEPYRRRRELLEKSVVPGGPVAISASVPELGIALGEAARGMGLDGIIAKRLDSAYASGPGADWMLVGTRPVERDPPG